MEVTVLLDIFRGDLFQGLEVATTHFRTGDKRLVVSIRSAFLQSAKTRISYEAYFSVLSKMTLIHENTALTETQGACFGTWRINGFQNWNERNQF